MIYTGVRRLFCLGRDEEQLSQRELHQWAHGNLVTLLCTREHKSVWEIFFEDNAVEQSYKWDGACPFLLWQIERDLWGQRGHATPQGSFRGLLFRLSKIGCDSSPPGEAYRNADTHGHQQAYTHVERELCKAVSVVAGLGEHVVDRCMSAGTWLTGNMNSSTRRMKSTVTALPPQKHTHTQGEDQW